MESRTGLQHKHRISNLKSDCKIRIQHALSDVSGEIHEKEYLGDNSVFGLGGYLQSVLFLFSILKMVLVKKLERRIWRS